MSTFAELGVNARTLAALSRQGITEPLAVQADAVPALLDGDDVVIEAPTGSGKSLAFLLPLVDRLRERSGPGPRALVVTPTRELAIQVERVFVSLESGLKCALLYGGVGYATQTLALKQGPDVVIGTPGRILDMIGKRLLALSRVEYAVLDEADEMLDAGFAPDVERILAQTYEPQMVLASATMPDWVTRLMRKHMQDPVHINSAPGEESKLEHGLLRARRDDKVQVVSRLLKIHPGAAIVFGRTKHGVRKLHRDLTRLGHECVLLQGDLTQGARDRAMDHFRSGRSNLLVATNVAARGLDISHVSLIVNFDLPDTPQWLTHRVGRTARNGAEGWAITLLAPEDSTLWSRLRREGAPDLPELDAQALLELGQWRYRAAVAAVQSAERRSGRRRGGRRRGGRPQAIPA
ncbi:MAG: DEAD/DEAH box helicase [Chloroflexi bacterium]|nr:MAG: DEAD/DEAH box helicase [Chloroflexota bacterium]